jgi:hypothetical protein
MRNEPIDFIGVDYSVGDRRVEEKILPLAQERKIGVLAYFPFDRRRIFERASSTPLPEWAAEFDAKTWAQFFLKYVISHPAVTVARAGTTKAAHMLDDIGGGIGRLPNEATRKRMAELVDALPPTPPAEPPPQPQAAPEGLRSCCPRTSWTATWVNYEYAAVGTIVTIRRDGGRLLVKSGVSPEGPLVARSETHFAAPWGATIEFQLDGQGKVTGAIVEQGPYRIPLSGSRATIVTGALATINRWSCCPGDHRRRPTSRTRRKHRRRRRDAGTRSVKRLGAGRRNRRAAGAWAASLARAPRFPIGGDP